jgi:uncharacterized membrane protein
MSKHVISELPELIQEGVVDEATATRIHAYYQRKSGTGSSRLTIALGILGSLLVGLGIILIVAHNWDSLSKSVRLVLAFTPLVVAQGMMITIIGRRIDSVVWREVAGTLLVLAIGAAIALVSQIYSIHGDLSKFLLVWTILSIPISYLLQSSVASMLVWIGATAFAADAKYIDKFTPTWYYLPLVLAVFPYYLQLIRKKLSSNFTTYHHWIVAISITFALDFIYPDYGMWEFLAFSSLFCAFVILSQLPSFDSLKLPANPWLVIGSVGIILSLVISSGFRRESNFIGDPMNGWPASVLGIMAVYLLSRLLMRRNLNEVRAESVAFLLMFAIFPIGTVSVVMGKILLNLLLFAVGGLIIRRGARMNHLGILNYGLLILTLQIIARFFDTEISFIIRGLLFILIGAGFFTANYLMIRKPKTSARE